MCRRTYVLNKKIRRGYFEDSIISKLSIKHFLKTVNIFKKIQSCSSAPGMEQQRNPGSFYKFKNSLDSNYE